MLTSFGLAKLLDDGETPYRWLIHPAAEERTDEIPAP
jgi:hypothetical protein